MHTKYETSCEIFEIDNSKNNYQKIDFSIEILKVFQIDHIKILFNTIDIIDTDLNCFKNIQIIFFEFYLKSFMKKQIYAHITHINQLNFILYIYYLIYCDFNVEYQILRC